MENIDPNAIIGGRRNYSIGIINRSKIIGFLKENYTGKTSEIADKLNLSKACVRYHLNILRDAKVVKKRGRTWVLSKNIQRTIDDFL
jgi:predicted transcriptional regulator